MLWGNRNLHLIRSSRVGMYSPLSFKLWLADWLLEFTCNWHIHYPLPASGWGASVFPVIGYYRLVLGRVRLSCELDSLVTKTWVVVLGL